MSNRLRGNLAGILLGGTYQGNLNGIGINDVSELRDKQTIQAVKNRANGVYQARQSSNVDHLTGITMIQNNEPSYRNNNQLSIGEKGSDLEKFFSYQKKLDEFYQNGGFANCKRVEDLPWNKQKKNEQIFEKFLHGVLERERERENNNYDLRSRFSLFGGGSIVPLSEEGEEMEDDRYFGNDNTLFGKLFRAEGDRIALELMDIQEKLNYGESLLLEELKSLKNIERSKLTEVGESILDTIGVFRWNPTIATLHIVIGLCIVAQKVQQKRETVTQDMALAGVQPAEIEATLKHDVPKWFWDEAGKYFIGNWVLGIGQHVTKNPILKIIINETTGNYMNFLDKLKVSDIEDYVTGQLKEWKQIYY